MIKTPTVYVVKTRGEGKSVQYAYLRYDEWDEQKGRPQPKPLASLGRADKLDDERLGSLGDFIREWVKKDSSLPFDALKTRLKEAEPILRILVSRDFGLRWLVEQAWGELGYKEVIAEIAAATKHQFRVDVAIFGMVLAEIVAPRSKLALSEWKDRTLFFPEGEGLTENEFYKAMDVLNTHYEEVEARLNERLPSLGVETEQLSHDTTTVANFIRYDDEERAKIAEERAASGEAIRSSVVNKPPLRMRGQSKDHRPELPQTKVQAIVGDHGLVLHHATLAGDTSDQKVTEAAVARLAILGYAGKDLAWAGDAGTNSADNRDVLRDAGLWFVLGEGASRTKVVKRVLATAGCYRQHPERPELSYKCVFAVATEEEDKKAGKEAPVRVYVIRRNEDEEAYELRRIERHLKEIKSVLAERKPEKSEKLLRRRKLAKYLTRSEAGNVVLDQAAIRHAKHLAGKSVIGTDDYADPIDLDDVYRRLFDVELLWKQLKSKLGLSRTRHRRADRIKAHHMVHVMAANIARWLERKSGVTIERLRRVFDNVHVQKVELKGGATFWECVELEPEQHDLLRKLGYATPPKRFTTTLP
ncbi:MAG: transposase [Deltaproteobacteria bacterium]|nr:transposase [Deltaproteobacteria bacterium]